MPYFTITDFAAGMDLRRASYTAPAGTLRMMKNCHVTPGGEIEKRFKFLQFATAPAGSKGLVEMPTGLYVFTAGGPGVVAPPSTWELGQLRLAVATSLSDIIDWDVYANRVFVTTWENGYAAIGRYYDGVAVPTAQGYYVRTYKNKVYTAAGSFLYFSKLNDPSNWTDTANGAGFIELSGIDADMDNVVALEAYYDKLAAVGSRATQLWKLASDPLTNQVDQTLRQAGTIAWRSVLQYGSGDVLFLAPDGVRSLRARNSSLAASVSDIGSPLDPVFQELYRTMGENWLAQTIAILQPVAGRFWIILPDRIYVLSSFPGPKINAWSMYTPTIVTGTNPDGSPIEETFVITAAVQYRNRIVVRDNADRIFVFGTTSDTMPDLSAAYDRTSVELIFPFHAGEDPATKKKYVAIDAAATGDWKIYLSLQPSDNPAQPDPEDYLGVLNGSTFEQQQFKIEGESTHASLRLRSNTTGYKLLSNIIVHYQLGRSD